MEDLKNGERWREGERSAGYFSWGDAAAWRHRHPAQRGRCDDSGAQTRAMRTNHNDDNTRHTATSRPQFPAHAQPPAILPHGRPLHAIERPDNRFDTTIHHVLPHLDPLIGNKTPTQATMQPGDQRLELP
ncbi:hypothetical protein C0Q70_19921 [Pomacea canaliculata]|uniref:Uncharacterized protein n=1 Tax=Pomacea canaliculata TaxID=400727 RepID=A0A2T7NE68_POMCA|nr:hypothetical protein C0Q70_19921 [Pomacea canaliculata]